MKGTLYRIFHIKSNKCYIGKTYSDIYKRLTEHIRDSKRFNRPLYNAFNEYGLDSFSLEILGEFEEGCLEEAEIVNIALYDSFNNGYNATIGGEGRRYLTLPEEDIVAEYQSSYNVKSIAEKYNVDYTTIKRILISYGIELKSSGSKEVSNNLRNKARKVLLIDTNEIYDNTYNCALDLIATSICENVHIKSVQSGIDSVCNSRRPSYKGFKFQWV